MNNTYCISFSDIDFQILHVSSQNNTLNVISAQIFKYPSIKPLDQLLSDENIRYISDAIEQSKKNLNIQNVGLSFVLPFNYAEVKRILLPTDSDGELKKHQIRWELETTLKNDINNYKISVLTEVREEAHKKAVVVAIKKEIIKKLQIIAQQNEADIENVILNCFALENFLINQKGFSLNKNYVFLKIDKNYLEYHFFSGDKYIVSQIYLLDNMSRTREEVIVETTNERNKNISNYIDKKTTENPLELIIYGSSVNQEIMEALKKGISSKVSYATIENFPFDDSYKFIESWGSFL